MSEPGSKKFVAVETTVASVRQTTLRESAMNPTNGIVDVNRAPSTRFVSVGGVAAGHARCTGRAPTLEARGMRQLSTVIALAIVSLAVTAHAQTGVRISLPICNSVPSDWAKFELNKPAGWSPVPWAPPPACGTTAGDCDASFSLWPTGNRTTMTETMDWGAGNEILAAYDANCEGTLVFPTVNARTLAAPSARTLFPIRRPKPVLVPVDYYVKLIPFYAWREVSGHPLLHVTGFVSNVTPTTPVYGQVVFTQLNSTDPLVLAIQVQRADNSWADWSLAQLSGCDARVDAGCKKRVLEVQASVPSNSNVRLELRPGDTRGVENPLDLAVDVYEATLFGAECFPDAANPGMCIQ